MHTPPPSPLIIIPPKQLRHTIDDIKPEKIGPYLENIKRYVDEIAGQWAEISVVIMARSTLYDEIRTRLGLPVALVPEKDTERWRLLLTPHIAEIDVSISTRSPPLDVFDAFTRHLVEMNDIVETRRIDLVPEL